MWCQGGGHTEAKGLTAQGRGPEDDPELWPAATHEHGACADACDQLLARKPENLKYNACGKGFGNPSEVLTGKGGPARGRKERPADVTPRGGHTQKKGLTARGRDSPTKTPSSGQTVAHKRRCTESALICAYRLV